LRIEIVGVIIYINEFAVGYLRLVLEIFGVIE
jgi:hypothetical protein